MAPIAFMVLLCCITCAIGNNSETPIPPNLSETFMTRVYGEINLGNETEYLMAYFGRDFANRKQFMNTSIIAGSSSVRSMQTYIFRYDLGYIYSIETCEKILVSNDDFFSMWSWLQDSQFLYHDDFFNMDIWGSQYQIMLGVSPDQPTYPVYFASPYATMGFVGFNPIAPSASQFDVPHFCLNATLKENEDETIHYQRIFNPNYLFKSKPSKTKEDSNMPAFLNIMNIIDLKSKGKFN